MNDRRILVLGESGQVAHALSQTALPQGWSLVFRGRREFDLTAHIPLADLIAQIAPDAVINAAAYTAVDRAESEPEAAYQLNARAPGELANACAVMGIPLVHFSTDYVFDGTKAGPYAEDDDRNPINVYGASKAAGEDAIAAAGGPHAILRTSWVYAATGTNFVRTMRRLAAEQEEVRVVADVLGRPTWAMDCAEAAILAVAAMAEGRSLGVLHVAGEGDATWAQVARAVFDHEAKAGRRAPRLIEVTSAQFPTAARRPANSRLDCSRIAQVLGWQARPWRYSLAACLAEMDRA